MQPREKHFYTILFLEDYFPKKSKEDEYHVELPELKKYKITNKTNTDEVKWKELNVLQVKHGLTLPLTLEMWDDKGKPIFYVPLLKEGIDSISVGQVVIESESTILLYFNEENPMPQEGETFKLALKTLPQFDTTSERLVKKDIDVDNAKKFFDEAFEVKKTGVAIVFKRHNLEAHFDLIEEFDNVYLHTEDQAHDVRYLVDRGRFQKVKWLSMYTDNLQDVLDQINTELYEIKFSWKNTSAIADDPYGYQIQRGHLPPHPAWRPW